MLAAAGIDPIPARAAGLGYMMWDYMLAYLGRLDERTVGKLLARLNFSRVSVRPRHPEQDIAAQEAHKKTSPSWSPRPFPSTFTASRSSSGGRMKRASASREA
jgi:hypothetical protein